MNLDIISEFKSPNCDARPKDSKIDFIILHYTEMNFDSALTKLCDPNSKVSAHYLIKATGEIYQLVSDDMRAWHAGPSYWRGIKNLNDCSIGIELDNLGNGPFTDVQMDSCIALCKSLSEKCNLHRENILGHSDIAPTRKLDPGLYFDWEKMSEAGLGIKIPTSFGSIDDFRNRLNALYTQSRLAHIGYDVEVTGEVDTKTHAARRAFQAHFCRKALLKKGLASYIHMDSEYYWDEEYFRMLQAVHKELSER